jgi:uncharacterized protein
MEYNLSPLQKAGCLLIWCYQRFLSPLIGQQCRFYPTCSEYTKQAIIMHGFFHGCYLGLKRILRCHPLNPGGFDPVPEKNNLKKK